MHILARIHRHHFWFVTFIIGASLLIGCAIWQSQQRPGQPEDELIFSHKRHIQMDIECEYCHGDILQSELVSESTLPVEADCMRCHKRTQGCELCHRDVKNAVHLAPVPYRAKFSHKFHLQLEQDQPIECGTCHLKIAESKQVADTDQPRMKVCQECHEVTEVDCTTCHENLGADVTFTPASHDNLWMERHRLQAPQNDELCAVCHRGEIRSTANSSRAVASNHSQNAKVRLCADCHRGDIWPEEIHEDNYIETHRLDASANSNTCVTCHDRQECEDCHENRGFRYETVHPFGFVFQHADQARRELTNCVACHEEDDCLSCHSTISPHPSGWDLDITPNNEGLCLKCHVKGEL